MMRHSKASTTTDVYMQSLEPEVRSAINAIHDELMGNGTTGPTPQNLSEASLGSRPEQTFLTPPKTEEEGAVSVPSEMERKPVRGVVLEFATRMRQSRGREVALND